MEKVDWENCRGEMIVKWIIAQLKRNLLVCTWAVRIILWVPCKTLWHKMDIYMKGRDLKTVLKNIKTLFYEILPFRNMIHLVQLCKHRGMKGQIHLWLNGAPTHLQWTENPGIIHAVRISNALISVWVTGSWRFITRLQNVSVV